MRNKCPCIDPKDRCVPFLDSHHIKTRKSGGSDHANNLIYLCRKHHAMAHQKGHTWMCKKFPEFKELLIQKGWEFDSGRNRWVNYSPEIAKPQEKIVRRLE